MKIKRKLLAKNLESRKKKDRRREKQMKKEPHVTRRRTPAVHFPGGILKTRGTWRYCGIKRSKMMRAE
jgi:hypothetical protein